MLRHAQECLDECPAQVVRADGHPEPPAPTRRQNKQLVVLRDRLEGAHLPRRCVFRPLVR
eukprot:3029982-Pyramimonas_sp.AAC.1